jgi:uncharacterized protein YndB with AHSA1/START domain
MNPESKGTATIEGKLTTLRYERRLPHPREVIWKAITDPKELVMWFNTKAVINGRTGGTIDFVNAPSGFHTTGCILNWDPPHIFEHEWHIAPHPDLPHGEPEAIIHWELIHDGDSNTFLILTFSQIYGSRFRTRHACISRSPICSLKWREDARLDATICSCKRVLLLITSAIMTLIKKILEVLSLVLATAQYLT